jgi:hypothetical protein
VEIGCLINLIRCNEFSAFKANNKDTKINISGKNALFKGINSQHPLRGCFNDLKLKRSYSKMKKINKKVIYNEPNWFNDWLVGFTDGDGTFTIEKLKNNKWILVYKISQKYTNAQLLYYIKEKLECGNITKIENGMWS